MTALDRECKPRADPVTLGEIFRHLGPAFVKRNSLNDRQRQAFRALAACRTPALGGGVWHCQACGHQVGVYHSCRDRHCPQCQGLARFKWVADRTAEVLPVPYFHTVFSIPHALNPLVRANMKALVGCLFRMVSQTLKEFGANPKHLGAEPGFLMVLHTWGRQLNFHPHIHCVVTGGGLSADRKTWVPVRNPKYLFPVKALSPVFRGKFLDEVEKLVSKGELYLDLDHRIVLSPEVWKRRRGRLCRKDWVVYAKPPFGGPAQVLKYLGAYTHRVAIANSRLVSFKDGMVRFRFKDYKQDGAIRIMTLSAESFAKRFLSHILPNGLVRIRYGGFLASCKKRACLAACRSLLGAVHLEQPEQTVEEPPEVPAGEPERRECPVCGKNAMTFEPIEEAIYLAFRRMIYHDTS